MKKRLILLTVVLFAACGGRPDRPSAGSAAQPDGVEVLSFHAKKRCPTCIAVERCTRETVETEFAARLADGSLTLRIVDLDENEALADRYRVCWSSLLVIRHRDGKETVRDLTPFAFAHARTNPEKFRAELKATLVKLLEI